MASPFADIRSKALVAAMLSVLLAFTALLPFATSASAQEATPETEVTATPDLPEITITVSDSSYSINLPVPVLPGQYVITVVNETESLAVADIVALPEDVSFGDFTSTLFSSFQGTGGELPEWWADANFAGGSWAGPGATSKTVANLTAGRWTTFSTNPASTQPAQNFTVVTEEEAIAAGYIAAPEEGATPVASPEASPAAVEFPVLESAAQIEVADAGITATGGASGSALWQVTNAGEQPHDLVVYQVAGGTDAAGAAAIATAVAAGEAPADATLFASIGILSPGATGYIDGNLEPGTYAVFSTLPDASGGLQSDAGVVTVLVVE
jgi:hypothetical protein